MYCRVESKFLLWNRFPDLSSLVAGDSLLIALFRKTRGLRKLGVRPPVSCVLHLCLFFVLHLCVEIHMKPPRGSLPRNSNQV